MCQRFECKRRYYAILVLSAAAWLLTASIAFSAVPAKTLQALVSDTAAQFQLAYRQYPLEIERRQEQLAAVLAAWRTAPRSEANNERLANWLRVAILSSMPGSRESLPAAPNFAAVAKAESQPAEKLTAPIEVDVVDGQPQTDPFRDDPTSERD